MFPLPLVHPTLARLALLPAALMLAAVVLAAADAPDPVIAQRGDARITAGDVRTMLDSLDPPARARVRANPAALAEMIRERLLRDAVLGEARTAQWDTRPEIAARAEDARVQVIVQSFIASQTLPALAEPTEAEIAAAYEASKARLTIPKQYELAQIALLVPPNATREAEDAMRRKILDIRAQALKPKADFADLARRLSQDPATAAKGGSLGWVREDVLIPPIRNAVMTMKDNAISEPIRGPDSWHIVRLGATRPAGMMPFDQARAGIAQALHQARAQAAARDFIQAMARKEPIQLNEIELARQFPATATKP